jgi:type IV secretion system protein VirB11
MNPGQLFENYLKRGKILSKNEFNDEVGSLEFNPWYENYIEFKYLENFLLKEYQEIHIHNSKNISTICNNEVQEHTIDNLENEHQLALEVLALKKGVNWNTSNPFVSFTCSLYGRHLRFSLSHSSINSMNSHKAFVRVLSKESFSFSDFSLSSNQEEVIKGHISNKANILIAGSTGSGKTSFISSMLTQIPKSEHVCVLEDTQEIIFNSPLHTHLLQNETSTLKDFCAYVLRMSPSRIFLGEIRSSEVVPFILSMNNGHKGLVSTIHSNNAEDAIDRIALLFSLYSGSEALNYELVLKLVCKNIDYVYFLENKKLKSIIRIISSEGSNVYFEEII